MIDKILQYSKNLENTPENLKTFLEKRDLTAFEKIHRTAHKIKTADVFKLAMHKLTDRGRLF